MSTKKIAELLAKLKEELANTSNDDQAHKLVQDLEVYISSVEDAEEPSYPKQLLEHAQLLETKFASRHPNIELVLRELVDMLARMGV